MYIVDIVSILTTCSQMMFCRFLETCRTLWRFCQASVSSFMLLQQIISSIFSSAQNCQFSKHKNEHTASKSKMREHNNTKQFGPFFNVVVGLLHMRVEDFFSLPYLMYVFSTFQGFGGLQFYSGHGFAIAAAFTIWLLLTMKYCRRRRGRDDWSPSLMNKVISWKILWWHVKYMCIALSPNWNREVRTNASGAHILFETFIILPFLAITYLLQLEMNSLIIAKCLIINPTSMILHFGKSVKLNAEKMTWWCRAIPYI